MSKWFKEEKFPPYGNVNDYSSGTFKGILQDWALNNHGAVYSYNLSGKLKVPLSDLCKEMESKFGGRVVIKNFGFTGLTEFVLVWEDIKPAGYLNVYYRSPDYCVRTAFNNEAFLDEVKKYLKDAFDTSKEGKVSAIINDSQGPYIQKIGVAACELIRNNYEESVITKFDHVIEDLSRPDPCGRIIIIDGLPGTGKTYLIRSMIGLVKDTQFVMLPANMVSGLTGPNLLKLFLGRDDYDEDIVNTNKSITLIIEDADDCLVPRDMANMSEVSTLLNVGDGILSSLLDLRVIATTNAGHVNSGNIDEAMLRPGRLCRRIFVPPLSQDHANLRYQELSGKADLHFTKPSVTLAEVYRAGKFEEDKHGIEKKKVGFFKGD